MVFVGPFKIPYAGRSSLDFSASASYANSVAQIHAIVTCELGIPSSKYHVLSGNRSMAYV